MTDQEARDDGFEREQAAWLGIAEGLGGLGYELNSMEETRQWVLDYLLPGYRKHPEPEWEYGLRDDSPTLYYGGITTDAEGAVRALADAPTYTRVRRRKAGPWEPVPSHTEGNET